MHMLSKWAHFQGYFSMHTCGIKIAWSGIKLSSFLLSSVGFRKSAGLFRAKLDYTFIGMFGYPLLTGK